MKDAFPKRFHHHFKDYVPNLASILSTKDWLKSAVQAHEHTQTRTHRHTHTQLPSCRFSWIAEKNT